MKTYTLGLYEKSMPAELSWKEKLEAAKSAGFDFLEMSIDETEEKLERLEMTEKERLELIKLTKDAGIPIGTMCLSGHRKYPLGSHDPEVKKKKYRNHEQSHRTGIGSGNQDHPTGRIRCVL